MISLQGDRTSPPATPPTTSTGAREPATDGLAPHRLFSEHRRLCLAAALCSLVLSLWAMYVDPVINNDGILYVQAAEHFSAGEWRSAFAVYKWPFYSLVISATSEITGLAAGRSAYLVNAALYVFLVLGFVALVRSLGGGRAALWSAAVLALAHPVLNEFRAFIIRDTGYWACYLWSLAYFFAYLQCGRRRLLLLWAALALLASLFRVEGVALLAVLPACLYAVHARGRRQYAALGGVAMIAAAVLAAFPLWQYVSEVSVSPQALMASPLQHVLESWRTGAVGILTRIEALQRDIPGVSGIPTAFLVYLCTVALIVSLELVKTLGIVFTGLAVYSVWRFTEIMPGRVRRWWLVVILIQGLLVGLFVFSNFFLAERYPVGLALAILAAIPLAVERVWRARANEKGNRTRSWRGTVVAALLAIEAVEGLNLATQKQYLRDAGLWLRANAPPGSTIYSNNRILTYYSGLDATPAGGERSWEEAMSQVWSGSWRSHDYFVLVMNEERRRNEVQLFRKIDAKPLRTFANGRGDRVLIFRAE